MGLVRTMVPMLVAASSTSPWLGGRTMAVTAEHFLTYRKVGTAGARSVDWIARSQAGCAARITMDQRRKAMAITSIAGE